jgi:predicted CXXCH cytochrome family protein
VTFLIRKIVSADGAPKGYQDFEVASSRLSVGRGTDQDLLLPGDRVSLRHAEISLLGQLVEIKATTSLGIVVNGRTCQSAMLTVGDQVLIGDYHLVIIERPDNEVDCAISVQQLQAQEYEGLNPDDYVTSLKSVFWLRKRAYAWALFIVLVLVALLIPVWLTQNPDIKERSPVALPDDSLWLSGPLHRQHGFIGENCAACHVKPFEPVQNNVCTECHEEISHHVAEDHPASILFQEERCASCHREHNEQQRMVMDDQRFCVSCHGVLATALGKKAVVSNVSDFTNKHPDFRLNMLNPVLSDGDWHWQNSGRQTLTPELKEQNNLRFDHQQHLDVQGLKNETGAYEVLECSSCHTRAEDGFGMVPLTMETSCSRCHSLAFDVKNPEREVPHGSTTEVLSNLREYFSAQFIAEKVAHDETPRRPGQIEITALQREGLEWVEQHTRQVAEDIFERRACVTCHEVEHNPTAQTDAERWKVRPNRLNNRWMLSSRFPHYKHRSESCGSCHAAQESTETTDILMPRIEQCQDCHGGEDTENKVLSMCITCHEYHQPDMPTMAADPR